MFSELPPKDVYRALSEKENSVLIDCRTRSEWVYVGIPDISQTGRELALIEWVDSTGQPNPDFLALCREKISADSSVFVICRSGARSAAACMALIENGYAQVCNVAEGFEGDLDGDNHRSQKNGWKFHQLPWQHVKAGATALR